MSDLYSPELTAVSLANFTISPVSFKHSQLPGMRKFHESYFPGFFGQVEEVGEFGREFVGRSFGAQQRDVNAHVVV